MKVWVLNIMIAGCFNTTLQVLEVDEDHIGLSYMVPWFKLQWSEAAWLQIAWGQGWLLPATQ